jgi:hypothetical protein
MALLEHISEKLGTHHGGNERIESAEDKAQRIVGEARFTLLLTRYEQRSIFAAIRPY